MDKDLKAMFDSIQDPKYRRAGYQMVSNDLMGIVASIDDPDIKAKLIAKIKQNILDTEFLDPDEADAQGCFIDTSITEEEAFEGAVFDEEEFSSLVFAHSNYYKKEDNATES